MSMNSGGELKIMSASIRNILASALAVGILFAATAADAKNTGARAASKVAGVWHCDVVYNDLISAAPFTAALMFGKDGNASVIANNDDNGLVSKPAYADVVSMKSAAFGRWKPINRKKVAMTVIYFETYGLASGAAAGTSKDTTKLRCDIRPRRNTMTGECYADIFAPNGDPVDGEPIQVLFPDEPVFTAECKRVKVR
jgi:hypothetical protein